MKPNCIHITYGEGALCGDTSTWPDKYMDDFAFMATLPTCEKCTAMLGKYTPPVIKDANKEDAKKEAEKIIQEINAEVDAIYLVDFDEGVSS